MSELKRRNKNKDSGEKPSDEVKDPDKKQAGAAGSSTNQSIPLRVISRIVVITSLLVVVYFSSKDDKVKTFAKQSELLPGVGRVVECSPDYLKEIDNFEGCYPKECKRYVSDKVISVREADDLLAIAKKGFKLGGSSGGASILDLHSGALSKGQNFVNIFKLDDAKDLFTENDFNTFRVIKEKIKYSVAHHFGVDPSKIYLTSPTFFSEMTPKKAVTIHDEYWHPHVDKETYKSFHYTTLLYLTDYGIDFKGGRFVFIDDKYNSTVEPRKARVSMFTSGRENLHYVEKVSAGVRYAMTVAFSCDKKFEIPDLTK
ncbi:2-oxoglutarate and iron-dependent oxygenase domain-containing protein 3-like [Ostrinia nubilalis]|uniref:2-oxoglutarate and iron-dependent oxygenase domain-containing protein 3-like n=1 Tax=Ostrinia nubilalis TaxID=29057 RepID=UPI0030826100